VELAELKNSILNRKLNNFYIFTGDELGLIDLYLSEMKKVLKCQEERQENVYDYISTGRIKSFIPVGNKLVIIREDKKFTTQEEIWDKLFRRRGNVVLIYSSIDKRSKFYKKFEEYTVTFDRVDKSILKPKVRSLIGLNDKNIDILLDCCQMDYARILLEIDKLKLFKEYDVDKLFIKFVNEGAIYREIPDSIFNFSDAVINRNKAKSFREYENCRLTAEPNIRLLSVLYNNFRQQIGFQMSKSPTPESTGLNSFILNLCRNRANKYTNKELIRALTLLRKIDTAVKTGLMDEEQSVTYFLVEIL
jgi:DNA polymerase III delta subunit